MKIQFIGGTRTVTGSQHLLTINGKKILLEYGLFQGRRNETYEKNKDFKFYPKEIDALILSHAHIDHSENIPNRAFARQSGTLDLAVEESVAEMGMQFMRGIVGSVHLDYHQRPPTHRMEIVGTLGTIRWDNSDGEVHLSKAGPDGRPGEWQRIPVPENFERNVMFLDEMRNFLDMVRGESKPACTLHDGIEALRLALAARQSAQTGQLVLL